MMPAMNSRITQEHQVLSGQCSPVLNIAALAVSNETTKGQDLLRRLATEIRLMIFEDLLIVWPKTVFRGAKNFGPLDSKEFDVEIPIPWQILQTCRRYHDEAAPIMYGKNKFVFCTGPAGDPGMFLRFPIKSRYMEYVTDLGIYFRADEPKKEAANRIAQFIKAINRRATKLESLVVLTSSDRFYEKMCPWDILFPDHPVMKALTRVVEDNKIVKHLKIRIHDGAYLHHGVAGYLDQAFRENVASTGATNRSITFAWSCSCPQTGPHLLMTYCLICGWPTLEKDKKPIETVVSSPTHVEAGMERTMDMQDDLFQLGILPPRDDSDDEEEDDSNAGPYVTGLPVEDTYEENRKAFDSGRLCSQTSCTYKNNSNKYSLLPGQVRRYRGEMKAPRVYYFQQTMLPMFFEFVEYEQYLSMVFLLTTRDG